MELFDDERENGEDMSEEELYLQILPSAVKHDIKNTKPGTVPDPDKTHFELLEGLDDINIARLTQILNHKYEKSNVQ